MNQFKSAWQFAFQHWQFLAVMAFPVFIFEVMTAYYLSSASILLESGKKNSGMRRLLKRLRKHNRWLKHYPLNHPRRLFVY